jgi:hypothetical protein
LELKVEKSTPGNSISMETSNFTVTFPPILEDGVIEGIDDLE